MAASNFTPRALKFLDREFQQVTHIMHSDGGFHHIDAAFHQGHHRNNTTYCQEHHNRQNLDDVRRNNHDDYDYGSDYVIVDVTEGAPAPRRRIEVSWWLGTVVCMTLLGIPIIIVTLMFAVRL